MNTLRKVVVGIAFLGTWLSLLIRFGASRYDNYLFYTDERPSVGYINSIGLGVAIVYLLGGIVMGAIMVGSIKHEAVKRSVTAFFGCIVLLVTMLSGADLALAILEVQHFVVVHCDVAFLCTISLLYALIPSHIKPPEPVGFNTVDSETLLDNDEADKDV